MSREQLQGVIAHEFSHMFNGDMRLNIRLMGALNGILILGILGYYLLYSASFTGRRRGNDKGGGAILALAIGLMAIGFAGTFFGALIKASVSRQREYLADATAVQFTRNPNGIAGALKRIGGLEAGSKVENPGAPEVSHAFFAQGISAQGGSAARRAERGEDRGARPPLTPPGMFTFLTSSFLHDKFPSVPRWILKKSSNSR